MLTLSFLSILCYNGCPFFCDFRQAFCQVQTAVSANLTFHTEMSITILISILIYKFLAMNFFKKAASNVAKPILKLLILAGLSA